MRWVICAVGLLGLIACGADGEPVQPTRNASITISDAGVSGVLRTGVRKGPFSVSLGLGL